MPDRSTPVLYMMLGYPGAGKTTTAEHIAKLTGAAHLSSDNFRLHMFREPKFTPKEHSLLYRALDYATELLLKAGVSVIYDANLNHYVHRKDKYDIADRTGAEARLIWIKTNEAVARKRATELAEGNPHRPYGNMETELFERLTGAIEEPHSDEPVFEISGMDQDMSLTSTRKLLERME